MVRPLMLNAATPVGATLINDMGLLTTSPISLSVLDNIIIRWDLLILILLLILIRSDVGFSFNKINLKI